MSITDKEFLLLLELQQDPLISYKKLAKKLNVSATTIKNLVQKLNYDDAKSNGIKGKRTPFGLYAIYNLERLGLTRIAFFLECRTKNQIKLVGQFCDLHPYTSYLTRIYGGKNGYFVIFNIPPSITEFIYEAVKFLIEHNIIESYELLIDNPVVYNLNLPNLKRYDQKSAQWDYNIKRFSKLVESMPEILHDDGNIFETKIEALGTLNLFDIAVLREWMTGAGPRKLKSEILENFEKDPLYDNIKEQYPINRQYLDERLAYLHPKGEQYLNLINNYGVRYDRSKFMLHNHFLFTGTASFSFLKQLANSFYQNNFPFYSTFSFSKPNDSNIASFIWWLSVPPKESSEITEWMYKNSQNLKTYIISGKPNQSIVYPIYHSNFITNTNKNGGFWNLQYDYCVTDVINEIVIKKKR